MNTYFLILVILLIGFLVLRKTRENFGNKKTPSYAVIITGEYRDSDVVKNGSMKKFLQNADIFCGTYNDENIDKWKQFGKSIKFAFIDKNNPPLPQGLSKPQFQTNMYQWAHLDNVLKTFNNELSRYDIIFKSRLDLETIGSLEDAATNMICRDDIMYAKTDQLFYCKGDKFIKSMSKFYNQTIPKTYNLWLNKDLKKRPELPLIPNNNYNGLNSFNKAHRPPHYNGYGWMSEMGFTYHILKEFDFCKESKIKIKINRGTFKKIGKDKEYIINPFPYNNTPICIASKGCSI
jgi:hypothetical protein